MRIDYEGIKALGRELGVPASSLIAMTPAADPFYVGLPARKAEAQWFADLWTRFNWGSGMHLRRAHYSLGVLADAIIKPTGDPYVNDGASWGLLKRASLAARYMNLIPAGSLVDMKNPKPVIFAESSRIADGVLPDVGISFERPWLGTVPDTDPDERVYPPELSLNGMKFADGQPFLVELWIEKTTQNDILVPIARRLGVNLVAGAGDTSEIRAREAVERAIEAGRPMRLLYISDFDPRGHNMPVGLARKIEFLLHDNGLDLDITLDPIVLTPEQCSQYNLPRKPFEKGGAARFEQTFGEGGVELDALEAIYPGEMARIVEGEILRYIDPTLGDRCRSAYWDVWRQLREISQQVREPYAAEIEEVSSRVGAIKQELHETLAVARDQLDEISIEAVDLWSRVTDELRSEPVEFAPDVVPTPRPATPPDAPLYDSRRDYLDQLDHYRAWQGRGGAG